MSNENRVPQTPGPSSWDKKQMDVGASLFLGGVVVIALLALLVWKGLF